MLALLIPGKESVTSEDVQSGTPVLEGCTVLEAEDVHVTVQEREEEPDYNEEGL